MRTLKNVVFGVGTLIMMSVCGCSTPLYMKQVPTRFNYATDTIEKILGMEDDGIDDTVVEAYDEPLSDREHYLKEKYAIILGVAPERITNYVFYDFVDRWVGTPYAAEGLSKQGASPSYFIQALYRVVYDLKLPKIPVEMYRADAIEVFTGRTFLKEGDLIFFRYSKDEPIADVGIYLGNDKIVAATAKQGLAIFNFNDRYFQQRYVAGGRRKPETEQK